MKKLHLNSLLWAALLMSVASAATADIREGSQVYAKNCEICHAGDGSGAVPDAPNFRYGDSLIRSDTDLFNSISSGKGMMPAFQGVLSEQEILNVIIYLRTLYQ